MKKILFYCNLLLSVLSLNAQELPDRYITEVFNNIQITEDVLFSDNTPTVRTFNLFGNHIANEESYGERTVDLKMDIYQPVGDTLSKKPVVIFAFGGGFVNGNRQEIRIRRLCETFAKRGFVTATIDYRIGMNINNPELSKRAVYRALQDGRSAVRFFRKNAANFKIDPNQIYLSGHSAGAFLSYHNVYLDKDGERPASTRDYFGRPDLGGLDEIGDNQFYTDGTPIDGKANGAMGFAGAVGDLNYLEGEGDVPGVYFHSSDDKTVPFGSGTPFSAINWIPGINLPTVHGSSVMSQRANQIGTVNEFYPYTNRGHSVHANGSELYPDIAPNGAQFFIDEFIGPRTTTAIQGDASYCTNCEPQTFTLSNNSELYYRWEIAGGTILERDPVSHEVLVQWDNNAVNRSLTVTPFSCYLAPGTSTTLFAGPDSCAWDLRPGLGLDIAAGSGEVFVIGANDLIYQWNNGNWIQRPSAKAQSIAVQGGGIPWIIGTDRRIYRYINNVWRRVRGSASDVGATGDHIYVSGGNNILYKFNSSGRWTGMPGGQSIRVDAAPNGDAWVVGTDNYVYQVQNGSWTPRKGDFKASDITVSAGSNTVWAIELDTDIPHRYLGNGVWEPFTGGLSKITVRDNGEVWGVNTATNIFSNDCFVQDARNSEKAIFQNEITTAVHMYPNPANSEVHITVGDTEVRYLQMSLTDFYGTELINKDFQSYSSGKFTIDVSSFKSGHYILKIGMKGKEPIYKRLIVN